MGSHRSVTRVVLRADADPSIGAGHLMRCLALARALSRYVQPVIATTCNRPELLQHVERSGIAIARLGAAHPHPSDADQVCELMDGVRPGFVVIDGYHFDGAYVDRLRSWGLRTLMIDDRPRLSEYTSDLLLDVNLGALRQPYVLAPQTTPLLGPRFTLVREEFVEAERPSPRVVPVASRLLVTMGGSDPDNATALVLGALERLSRRFDVTVVVGGANPRLDAIRQQCARLTRASVVHNTSNFESLMAETDMAIAAVGGTIWELAYMGVPTLLLSATDLHHRVAEVADRYGAHRWLGSMDAGDEQKLADAVVALADDSRARSEMRRLGRLLIDGGGSARTAAAICADDSKWEIRPAQLRDAEPVWEMRDAAREPCESYSGATFPGFEPWFQDAIDAVESRLWVLERYGSVAGFARYDRDVGVTNVAVAIAPAVRERGFAVRLLRDTWSDARDHFGPSRMQGTVFERDGELSRAFADTEFMPKERLIVDGRPCVVFER